MMKSMKWACAPLVGLLLVGCAVTMVSPYDDETRQATLELAKQVDGFYVAMLEHQGNRDYNSFAGQYVEIETELRGLLRRNQVRSMNSESVTISENLLELWVKYKDRHKKDNHYKDGNAKLEWKRLARMFGYALEAEEAKKGPAGSGGEG
jgi:hypothetical protein